MSEASVKRWADSGLLPAERTAGGHRRFRPEDLAVVGRAAHAVSESRPLGKRAPSKSPAPAGRREELAPSAESELVEETFRALVDGRAGALAALLVNLSLCGQSVGVVADRFLCAAMRRVGELWYAGELSVAQEHAATSTATGAWRKLGVALGAPAGEGPRALCCSVESDFHELPVRLAALTLEARGLRVFNFGTNTPFSALTGASERFRPQLVCVSSTMLSGLDRAAREYAEFYKAARRVGARVVLGGAGFAEASVRRRFTADLHAASFRQLEEFAETLAAVEP